MEERPELSTRLTSGVFRSYYYLKEELTAFCRASGLRATGGKPELTERIAWFLDHGEAPEEPAPARPGRRPAAAGELTPERRIEPDFVCSEVHRAFFRAQLGRGFSFNVAFQKWLKANAGRTYGEAVEAYRRIQEEKKRDKTAIGRQFEYNAYIRAFFEANPGRQLDEAIRCWRRKKSLPGHNRYEDADLAALE